MNPFPIKIAGWFTLALILIGSSFIAGWKTKGWRDDSQYKEVYVQSISAVKTQDMANQKMAQEYQRKVSAYQKQVDALSGRVKTEVTENNVYSNCVLPDSGVQLINAAIESANKIITSK